MADAENPWPDLVVAAKAQIRRANEGNTLAALDILRQAAIGLRDILSGGHPDPERLEYLSFLLTALDQIDQEVPADKALGLWSDSRPHSIPDERDLFLFVAVGLELDQAQKAHSEKPVDDAIAAAAKRYKCDKSTVKKAWERYGAKKAWEQAHDSDLGAGE
jgi:hypothetical protein